jgi:hypothetical protein
LAVGGWQLESPLMLVTNAPLNSLCDIEYRFVVSIIFTGSSSCLTKGFLVILALRLMSSIGGTCTRRRARKKSLASSSDIPVCRGRCVKSGCSFQEDPNCSIKQSSSCLIKRDLKTTSYSARCSLIVAVF